MTIVIDSDAHGVETLANIRYGVATARRAWLTADDVANTRSWDELRKLRKREKLRPLGRRWLERGPAVGVRATRAMPQAHPDPA